jgi:glycosyltransferase involved in cell wall biosynthesis
MWKPKEYVKIFNKIGYGADIEGNRGKFTLSEPNKYDVLFGSTPHFSEAAHSLPPRVTKIFYSTGMHWAFQNRMLQQRIEMLENRRGVSIDNSREVTEDFDIDIADYIILMGDRFTQKSFINNCNIPENCMYRVTNAGFDELNVGVDSINEWKAENCQKNFLWLAGGGPILKGLDIALEVFKDLTDVHLHVCGNIQNNNEVVDIYHDELYETDNIHTHGWVNLHSNEFKRLTKRCGFHLSPSCSEGISGAVINTMHQGVIPVVTRETGIDVEEFGYQIEGTVNSIRNTVTNISSLPRDDLIAQSKIATQTAMRDYSREKYIDDMENAIHSIL